MYYKSGREISTPNIRLLMIGRQFILPGGGWLVLGRNESENENVTAMRQPGALLLSFREWPGPQGVLRGGSDTDLEIAVGVMKKYSKKGSGRASSIIVYKEENGDRHGALDNPEITEDEQSPP